MNLVMSPKSPVAEARSSDRKEGTIMCQADKPLTACQFIFRDLMNISCNDGPIIDLSRGHDSETIHVNWCNNTYFKVAYSGSGLQDGECGVHIKDVRPGIYRVSCRARSQHGGWAYDETAMYASSGEGEYTRVGLFKCLETW